MCCAVQRNIYVDPTDPTKFFQQEDTGTKVLYKFFGPLTALSIDAGGLVLINVCLCSVGLFLTRPHSSAFVACSFRLF